MRAMRAMQGMLPVIEITPLGLVPAFITVPQHRHFTAHSVRFNTL